MSYELEDCLKRKKLYRFPIAKRLVQKELKVAEDDLKDAKESLSRDSYKWATIQGYYAMFHAARADFSKEGAEEVVRSAETLIQKASDLLKTK